jgi:hypothetical protein
MNIIFNKDDLHEISKNLTGNYFLFPSQFYGPWLFTPTSPGDLRGQALLNYVSQLGGNPALLSQALAQHASILDPPYLPGPGDPEFEVIVGTGVATIASIHVIDEKHIQVDYDDGDGTVPAHSAARGTTGPNNPNNDRTHYICGVEHVPLPGHQKVTDAIKDYLRFGEDIEDTTGCPYTAYETEVVRLRQISAAGSGGGLGPTPSPNPDVPMSIDEAEARGLVDYLDLPYQKFIVSTREIPEIALPDGAFVRVTPLSSEIPGSKGQPTIYGPLNGPVTLSVGPNGPVVLDDGQPAPLLGDVNCDHKVTAFDTLLLLLHAGGTPPGPADGCTAIGSGSEPFGDMDCDASVGTSDVLADLRIASGATLDFMAACY